MTAPQVSDADVVAEHFATYERALMADDVDTLAGFFWNDATRYGTDGNQHGADEIDRARRRVHAPLHRTLDHTLLRVVSDGVVVAETQFVRSAHGTKGRQTQVWVRRDGEWRILHAHVSMHPA